MELMSFSFFNRVIESDAYKQARKGNIEAAYSLIRNSWESFLKSGKTKGGIRIEDGASAKLKTLTSRLSQEQNVAFLPMPSTTGHNILPKEFALALKSSFENKVASLSCLQNSASYIVSNSIQSTISIPTNLRWMVANREFVFTQNGLKSLQKKMANKHLYIIDEMMGSGASAFALIQALKKENFTISGVISLSGKDIFEEKDVAKQNLIHIVKTTEDINFAPSQVMAVSAPAEVRSLCAFLSKPLNEREAELKTYRLKLLQSAQKFGTVDENKSLLKALEPKGRESVTQKIITWQLARRQNLFQNVRES